MRVAVPSPPLRQPRYGLVASVGGEPAVLQFTTANHSLDPNTPADAWAEGIRFSPDFCASDTDPFDPTCENVDSQAAFSQAAFPDLQDADPFGIWDSVKCSTLSNDLNEVRRRAHDRLITSSSYKIEHEFWTGDWAQANGKSNMYLADGSGGTTLDEINSGTALPLMYALARLQDQLGVALQGSRGMIHATTYTVSLWTAGGGVFESGGRLYDRFGNIIVAGSGYDGSAPDGTTDATFQTQWAYATPEVDVRLTSPVETEWQDFDNNVNIVVSQRLAVVSWAKDCAHLGVNVDLCTPCCTAV